MKRYAFIINPKSGRGRKKDLYAEIAQLAKTNRFSFEIFATAYPGHATTLASAAAAKFDVVFAVGGDGTVNETAKGLLNEQTPLGIIPAGSGNGIARHLRIPINQMAALKSLITGIPVDIDVWMAGDTPFLMLCGLGFDALIAQKISKMKSRGLQAYIRLVTSEFAGFKPKRISISWKGGQYSGNPFLVNLANGSQFGNEMKIAPKASITDGYLDLGIIEKIPLQLVPELVLRMRNGTMHNFKYYTTVKAGEFHLDTDYPGINIDGEYHQVKQHVSVKLSELKLKVLIPQKSKGLI